MTTKCPTCGLVNFAETDACRRCGAPLVATGSTWNPGYEQPSSYAQPQFPQPPPFDPYAQGGGWQSVAPYDQRPVYGAQPAAHYGYVGYAAAAPTLASRGARLGAVIVDQACLFGAIAVGVLLVVLGGGEQALTILGIGLAIVLFLAIAITQLVLLSSRGQTIGKRLVGIRIVKLDTGENGGFVANVVMRAFVPALIGAVPYVGPLFSIVDTLFIFREDYRCIHDHIAGTVVVSA